MVFAYSNYLMKTILNFFKFKNSQGYFCCWVSSNLSERPSYTIHFLMLNLIEKENFLTIFDIVRNRIADQWRIVWPRIPIIHDSFFEKCLNQWKQFFQCGGNIDKSDEDRLFSRIGINLIVINCRNFFHFILLF